MSEGSVELRRLVVLATPIVAAQVGSMMLGVVDTIMVGGIGSDALAAVALGTVWVLGTLVFGLGVALGIDPLLTQAHGAGDGAAVGLALQRGLVVAGLVSLPIGWLWLWTEDVLLLAGQTPTLARMAHDYVIVQVVSVPAFLGFTVLRSYLQARSIVAPTLWVTLIANLLNAAFNYVLIHGELGFPRLGLMGAGIATGLTRTLLFVLLALVIWRGRMYVGAWRPWSRAALDARGLGQIFALGLPVGAQLGLEMWAFQLATLFAGWLGEKQLAAHVVALNLASMSFMVPLGISMAAVTRVGNLLGAGRPQAAQRAAWVALAMGAGVMCVAAVSFVLLRGWLPQVYTADLEVLAVAGTLLPIAGAFQLFDGTQVVGGGILRGMGRTRPAAVFNLLGYYVLGLPVAYYLAFEAGMGVTGIWWGLTLGLMVVALSLVLWVGVRGPASMRGTN